MKILLLGHNGLLGSNLFQKINKIDTTDLKFPSDNFRYFIAENNYDIIINCAVNKVSDPDTNILLPIFLCQNCRYLIQFSSDAVFSGKKSINQQYSKTDKTDPICTYGDEKSKMEKILLYDFQNALVIRTSFIDEKSNLVKKIISNETSFYGFENYLWSGLTSNQVVKMVLLFIEEQRTGLCHLFSKNTLSKYELAKQIAKLYNIKKDIIPKYYPIINRQIDTDFNIYFEIRNLIYD